jgi:hydroxymethyl cephem carbamoyltransferase
MDIVGYKAAGHDGAVCCIEDGVLRYSIEAEKDSGDRHALLGPEDLRAILDRWQTRPAVVCSDSRSLDTHLLEYQGISLDEICWSRAAAAGREFEFASVPHELAHIACAYALSDLPEGQEFYALVWEGYLGRLYHVDRNFLISKLEVMDYVGVRYSFPYHATGRDGIYGHSAAGKIMALAGLARPDDVRQPRLQRVTELLLDSWVTHARHERISLNGDLDLLYRELSYLDGKPVDSPEFVALCRALQEGIFQRFHEAARRHVGRKLPLLIAGGCALNCDWNTQWRNCGLFSSVFVPPVPNDCGIAIGVAAAVNYVKTGRMKLRWDVYAGEEFVEEEGHFAERGFREQDLDLEWLCEGMLERDWVVAWVHGRYEMGPRALCHRSLIAAPFRTEIRERLNAIKQREYFRPVAPVCLEDAVGDYFDWRGPSPHMLYFQHVRSPGLRATTHLDGTARAQTVNESQDKATYSLLQEMRKLSGVGVACNTSLNFLGKGFINRSSDLARYAGEQQLDAVVVNDRMYVSRAVERLAVQRASPVRRNVAR